MGMLFIRMVNINTVHQGAAVRVGWEQEPTLRLSRFIIAAHRADGADQIFENILRLPEPLMVRGLRRDIIPVMKEKDSVFTTGPVLLRHNVIKHIQQ